MPEAIAADQNVKPRTLQRFLESIKWDHTRLRDRCQQIVAKDCADSQAIGVIDESGTAKSGNHTAGVKRQYNGNRGKVENSVVSVAISFPQQAFTVCSMPVCSCLKNGRPIRAPKKDHIPDEVTFKTKPQIALDLIDRAIANGILVLA